MRSSASDPRRPIQSPAANAYDDAPSMAEFYDYITPLAVRPDIAFYVDAARECVDGDYFDLCWMGLQLPAARP